MPNIDPNARLTVPQKAELAHQAHRAGELTMEIIEKVRQVISDYQGRNWDGLTGAFLYHLFRRDEQLAPTPSTVRDAMLASNYVGATNWDESCAPIGAIHWVGTPDNLGWAAVDMGPMGLLTVGHRTDSFFAPNVGYISRVNFTREFFYLGWSLDFAGSEPLVSEQVVFRGSPA